MQPSWTFPILQAMQQHRGSQLQRTAPQERVEADGHTDTAMPPPATAPESEVPETKKREPQKP
jgi:hypothetical protein